MNPLGQGEKSHLSNCENYLFKDHHAKSGIPDLDSHLEDYRKDSLRSSGSQQFSSFLRLLFVHLRNDG